MKGTKGSGNKTIASRVNGENMKSTFITNQKQIPIALAAVKWSGSSWSMPGTGIRRRGFWLVARCLLGGCE